MMRSALSTLLVAALGTATLSAAWAQGTATKSKGAASDTVSGAHKNVKLAKATTSAADSAVVGSVNGKTVSWGELLANIKADNPTLLNTAVAQYVAGKAVETFYGPSPKETFTITRSEAVSQLRLHPTRDIAQMLDGMLTRMAIDQAATRENVQPTTDQITTLIKQELADFRVAAPQEFNGMSDEQFLAKRKMTMAKLIVNYRPQVQARNLVEKSLTKQLGHPVGPDDMLQARHLLIAVKDMPPDASADDKKKADAEALAKIQQLAADIKAKKITFEAAVQANSDDPGTKPRDGDLGVFMRGSMVKEFDAAAFKATPGVITDPVKTQFGYHLILVTKLGKDLTPADRAKALRDYDGKQMQQEVRKIIEQDSKVENKLAALVPPPQGGGGLMPNGGRPRPQ